MKPPSWHKQHPKRQEGENYHHVFFEKNLYKGSFEKMFRNHVGLVLPLNEEVHSYLHRIVPPPPKPLREEMADCMEFIRDRDKWNHLDNPYWGIEATMQYFVYRGADKPEHEERCHDIRHNLAQQIGIMAHEHTGELSIVTIDQGDKAA